MNLIETKKISKLGILEDLQAATASDCFKNGPSVFVGIRNTSGAVRNVTIPVQKTVEIKSGYGKVIKNTLVVTIQNGETKFIGPFAYAFEDTESTISINYDFITGVAVGVFRLPKPRDDVFKALVCNQVSLIEFNSSNCTTTIDENNVIYENDSGGVANAQCWDNVNTFSGNSSVVQLEFEIKDSSDPFTGEAGGAIIGDVGGGAAFVQGAQAFLNTGPGTGVLLSALGAPIQAGLTFPAVPFKGHIEVDLSDGSGTYKDSINSIALPVIHGGAGANTLAIFNSGLCPSGAGETIEVEVDAIGPFAFPPTNPAAVRYCDAK